MLLQTSRHVTEINSRYYGLSRYYGNVDTCRPPSATFPLFFSLTIADTSFTILNHIIKSDITREENKETILQLGANMKISCLWPVFFFRLATYIPFQMFRDEPIYFLSYPGITESRYCGHWISPRGCPQRWELTVQSVISI